MMLLVAVLAGCRQPETRKEEAAVNGADLYFETAGSGEPVVLIHGWSFDTRCWDDQFSDFARHYLVLRYDMRGFGRSSLPVPVMP
jgi:pimeloyl-ACP methyl ester carboxylesterase